MSGWAGLQGRGAGCSEGRADREGKKGGPAVWKYLAGELHISGKKWQIFRAPDNFFGIWVFKHPFLKKWVKKGNHGNIDWHPWLSKCQCGPDYRAEGRAARAKGVGCAGRGMDCEGKRDGPPLWKYLAGELHIYGKNGKYSVSLIIFLAFKYLSTIF